MYLHHILTRNENSLILNFFQAQNKHPAKNDWSETIKKDLVDLDIKIDHKTIKQISKKKFKKYLKIKTKIYAFKELMKNKIQHSKMDNITYSSLEKQPYIASNKIFPEKVKMLFQFRTHMSNVKHNFKNQFPNDNQCPLCEFEDDTQEHLMSCEILHENTRNRDQYKNIFSRNLKKQIQAINILSEAWKKRQSIIETLKKSN